MNNKLKNLRMTTQYFSRVAINFKLFIPSH